MAGRASALAVLGLPPGADAPAIEQAYKRLIKLHHPDREGGDSSRAAEINRAYRELRGGRAFADPLQFNDDVGRTRARSRGLIAALVALALVGFSILAFGSGRTEMAHFWPATAQRPLKAVQSGGIPEVMNAKLHTGAIDLAVGQAFEMFRTKDEFALSNWSNACERQFRDSPGTLMLDRCAAFDDAVVGLENRDPLRDEGPFAALAVTGRQWSSAATLSNDDLAIDSRLDRVRLRVELRLAALLSPPEQEEPPEPAETNSA